MESAIAEFAKSWQVLKVFGHADDIAQAKQIWRAMSESDDSIQPPDAVTFVVQGYPGDCSALRRERLWEEQA